MAKTIMISDDAYRALTKLKQGKESYTELVSRLAGLSKNKNQSLLECAGFWHVKQSRRNWRNVPW
jgi:predicted CopG family antitoxin